MKIEDTLSQKKEQLPDSDILKIFVCGPTVYDNPHIGNARTYVFFDIFVKYLRSKGRHVSYLQNITDLDDKIIDKAQKENLSSKAIAKKFTGAFMGDMKKLGVDSVDIYAPATDYIPEIIAQIKKLIQKKHAYIIPGDGWYFDLKTFKDYGKLSKRTAEQAEDSVSRIDENAKKKNRGDFCLWKFSKPGEPVWKTDLGNGRPGWHIEDTAITEHFFGPQYDIHGGGMDLIFPHHEAEIAQQESASGKKPFVKIWMHLGMLTVNGKKMSKSLGNIITVPHFLKNHSPALFRFLIFSNHYRSPFDYTPLAISEARKNLWSIESFVLKTKFAEKNKGKLTINIQKFENAFHLALEDDFNTPKALGIIFELISEVSANIWNTSPASLEEARKFVKETLGAIGIKLTSPAIPAKIKALALKREKFRTSKQFKQSDDLRRQADELGYIIEDTPLGPFACPKHQK